METVNESNSTFEPTSSQLCCVILIVKNVAEEKKEIKVDMFNMFICLRSPAS
jgi:hypothetical protein